MWVVWNTALAKLNCVMMVRFFFQSKKCVSNLALISFYGSVRNLLSLVFFLTWGNLLVLNIFYHLSILFSICGVCWQIETICTKVISSLLFHLTLGASSLSLSTQVFFKNDESEENCGKKFLIVPWPMKIATKYIFKSNDSKIRYYHIFEYK